MKFAGRYEIEKHWLQKEYGEQYGGRTCHKEENRVGSESAVVSAGNQVDQTDTEAKYAVSTIYRILAAFEEKGLVTRTTWMGDGTVVYELNRGGHTHYAVCLECHKRVALPGCPFAHVHLEEEPGDFTVTGHKLELYGYCKECREARKNRRHCHSIEKYLTKI